MLAGDVASAGCHVPFVRAADSPRRAVMFRYSELRNDSRVEREARALVHEGWTLRVIAANDPASRRQAEEAHEGRDGYESVRGDRSPAPAKLAQRAAPAAVNGHGAAAAN